MSTAPVDDVPNDLPKKALGGDLHFAGLDYLKSKNMVNFFKGYINAGSERGNNKNLDFWQNGVYLKKKKPFLTGVIKNYFLTLFFVQYLRNIYKKIVYKFVTDWFSHFREIEITDFENTVLRKTHLKFQT